MTDTRALPLVAGLLLGGVAAWDSSAATISSGTFTEDFSDALHYDATASTGTWNVGTQQLQARRVASADPLRPLDFGDGSLGSVTSANGYTFDTNAYPNGYNFVHLTISGGTITVTGSNPLIIRALGNVSITPTINVSGSAGQNGAAGTSPTPAGGTSVACRGTGGVGGVSGGVGGNGVNGDGTVDAGTGGAGNSGATPGGGAIFPPSFGPGAAATFDDAAPGFGCAGGGGGGGGHSTSSFTGGAGGGGGGAVRILAAGSLSVGTLSANGGAGGAGVGGAANDSAGGGAGGGGGAIWLQTLAASISSVALNVAAGGGGAAPDSNSGSAASAGVTRQDFAAGGTRPTGNVVPGTYYVTSKAYDFGTGNLAILAAPTLTETIPAESDVQFAGSADGSSYSAWVADPTTLSDRGYRYLKFRAILSPTTATTPAITQIRLSYAELGVQLRGGACAPARGARSGSPWEALSWAACALLALGVVRLAQRSRL